MRRTPYHAAIGTHAMIAARPMSAAIMIGRLRRRSTHTPANSATQMPASTSADVTNATSCGLA